MVLLIKLIPLTVPRFVKAITALGSLNLDEGRVMGVTMLLAHSVLGIVAPEISAPRFRQGTSGEGWRDGILSLWWQRGAGCAALSPLDSSWRDGRGVALAKLLAHVQHFALTRGKHQKVGKEAVPETVPVTAYTLPQTTLRQPT